MTARSCSPSKDFMRHIVNHVLSEVADRVPISVFNEIRNRLALAEEKYKFSLFGGSPEKLAEYLDSEDFDNLIVYAKSAGAEWIIAKILDELAKAYKDSCPFIAEKVSEVLTKLESGEPPEKARISSEVLARALKLRGYRTSISDDGTVIVSGPNFMLEAEVVDGVIRYKICKEGKLNNINKLIIKIEKMREI
ncbi:MAG: hypothetical protein GSR74_02040 [Desulfurococcales archaeon]|nr:hypothetical protein [Desulfurococcales archaeon]